MLTLIAISKKHMFIGIWMLKFIFHQGMDAFIDE